MSNNIFFERGQMADKPNNYLWNGDCLELMKDIPDKSMDAIICDLPYGTTTCKWDSVIPFEPLWKQYKRIIKDNGAIVLFGSQPFTSALIGSNYEWFKYEWIWKKNTGSNFLQANYQPIKRHENICIFSKANASYSKNNFKMNYYPILDEDGVVYSERKNQSIDVGLKSWKNRMSDNYEFKRNKNKGTFPFTVLEYKNVINKKLHPTQKPLELIKYLVKTYTNENDWVLDNTCGSNTTGVACYDLNRNYIGIEKDKDIYEVAKKRVEKNILLRANKPKTLFDDRP